MNKTPTNELSYKLSKDNIAQERYKNPEDSRLLIAETKDSIEFNTKKVEIIDKDIEKIKSEATEKIKKLQNTLANA